MVTKKYIYFIYFKKANDTFFFLQKLMTLAKSKTIHPTVIIVINILNRDKFTVQSI